MLADGSQTLFLVLHDHVQGLLILLDFILVVLDFFLVVYDEIQLILFDLFLVFQDVTGLLRLK